MVSRDLSWPVSLAYDFMDDKVYWADEKLRCIGSASLDGDNIKVYATLSSKSQGFSFQCILLLISQVAPCKLAVVLFQQILQLAETPSPFSVAVFSDRVFWSDTKRRTVRSADKRTGKYQKVLLKKPGQPFGLKVRFCCAPPPNVKF